MLDASTCRMLEDMGIGPVWLLRETPDPIAPQKSAPVPVVSSAVRTAVSQRTPAVSSMRRPVRAPAFAQVAPVAVASMSPTQKVALPEETLQAIRTADWATLKTIAQKCQACPMATTRQNMVFAQGEPGPKLVIIGEAPGSEEDLQGLPFVGKSGRLLTAMLESLNIVRGRDVVILNVLKCRPPRNRNPEPDEIACCGHFLRRQLELLEPKVLFLAGRFAVEAMLHPQPGFSIGRQRGQVHQVEVANRTVPAVVTYHPSYLLRSPDEKAKAWDDLLLLKRTLREAGIEPPAPEKIWH